MLKKNMLIAGFFPLFLVSSFVQAKVYVGKNEKKSHLSVEAGLQLASLGRSKGQKSKKNRSIYEICNVPVVIDRPGKWFAKKELVYGGSGAAIIIAVDGVSIDFLNHDLVLTDPAATGILAQGVREIVIKNDAITTPTQSDISTSNAILLHNCEKVTIENIFTSNTFGGVGIDNSSSDIHFSNCHFKNHTGGSNGNGAAVYGLNSAAISFDGCTFEGTTGNPLTTSQCVFLETTSNVRISSCIFNNCDTALQALNNAQGILLENSQVTSSPTNAFNMIQLGGQISATEAATPVFDVTVSNCFLFNHAPNNAEFDAFTAPAGSGLIVDQVIIDAQARADQFYPVVAGLHIGQDQGYSFPASFNNVIVRNTLIKNANDNGIVAEANSSGILIDTCNIEQAVVAGIHLYGSQASTIKNSLISLGSGNGILLEANFTAPSVGATANTILNNTVSSNTGSGVVLAGGAAPTALNAVQNNVLTNNGTPQIVDSGTGNITAPNQILP